MRIKLNLNHQWDYVQCFTEAFAAGEACPESQAVDLPHSCAVTPFHYFDESVYQTVCGYRRFLDVPAEWAGKRVFLHVGAAAHRAEVFVDGKKLAEHRCGYTAFRVDLTGAITPGARALLVLRVDSRESLDQPPFGLVVDYMTYGGLYREVWLEICEQSAIDDVFARSAVRDGEGVLTADVTLMGSVCGGGDYRLCAKLVNDGRIPLEKILSDTYPADRFLEAMYNAANARGLKHVITF